MRTCNTWLSQPLYLHDRLNPKTATWDSTSPKLQSIVHQKISPVARCTSTHTSSPKEKHLNPIRDFSIADQPRVTAPFEAYMLDRRAIIIGWNALESNFRVQQSLSQDDWRENWFLQNIFGKCGNQRILEKGQIYAKCDPIFCWYGLLFLSPSELLLFYRLFS